MKIETVKKISVYVAEAIVALTGLYYAFVVTLMGWMFITGKMPLTKISVAPFSSLYYDPIVMYWVAIIIELSATAILYAMNKKKIDNFVSRIAEAI